MVWGCMAVAGVGKLEFIDESWTKLFPFKMNLKTAKRKWILPRCLCANKNYYPRVCNFVCK